MAKNDYYVIVYRVLMYLYNCLRQDMLGKHLESDIMISPKGISFLHENSTIDKVKKSVKGIAVIISDIPGL